MATDNRRPPAPEGVQDAALPPGPFAVYEDYDMGLHIIDGSTRVVLSDSFAYDKNVEARIARMEAIAAALNRRAPSVNVADQGEALEKCEGEAGTHVSGLTGERHEDR